jgi:gas vesicle protein
MADRNENLGSYGSSLVIFLLGAAVGATVAILYAPMSGMETRANIATKAEDLKHKATDLKDQVVEKASHWKDAAAEKLSALAHKDNAGEAANAGLDGASQVGQPTAESARG